MGWSSIGAVAALVATTAVPVAAQTAAPQTTAPQTAAPKTAATPLAAPVRLAADGAPIEIGKLSQIAHAGPWLGDFTGDGVRDLLVGDFPGYFWLFENTGTEQAPVYTSRGKLQAGGKDAKTPVY